MERLITRLTLKADNIVDRWGLQFLSSLHYLLCQANSLSWQRYVPSPHAAKLDSFYVPVNWSKLESGAWGQKLASFALPDVSNKKIHKIKNENDNYNR